MAGETAGEVGAASLSDRAQIVDLWEACGLVRAYNPPDADFHLALDKANSDILVLRDGDLIVGTVMVGHDGHRGWIYYPAVAAQVRNQGLGAQLVRAAEAWLADRGIRKVQLMVRETNLGVQDFYERLGYERSPVTVMQRWLDGTESA